MVEQPGHQQAKPPCFQRYLSAVVVLLSLLLTTCAPSNESRLTFGANLWIGNAPFFWLVIWGITRMKTCVLSNWRPQSR